MTLLKAHSRYHTLRIALSIVVMLILSALFSRISAQEDVETLDNAVENSRDMLAYVSNDNRLTL